MSPSIRNWDTLAPYNVNMIKKEFPPQVLFCVFYLRKGSKPRGWGSPHNTPDKKSNSPRQYHHLQPPPALYLGRNTHQQCQHIINKGGDNNNILLPTQKNPGRKRGRLKLDRENPNSKLGHLLDSPVFSNIDNASVSQNAYLGLKFVPPIPSHFATSGFIKVANSAKSTVP